MAAALLNDITDALIERARGLAALPGRALLGVCGPPGAGKSTVTAALAAAVAGSVVVPMDGFHLPTVVLAGRGLVAERGTPRTFDADGYVALLTRLRAGGRVLAPSFDRSREEPVPDAIEVPAGAPLVITEGNYLLLDEAPWPAVRPLLDECWYVDVAEELRLERLIARHMRFGRSREDAVERATYGSDAANARRALAARDLADLVVAGEG